MSCVVYTVPPEAWPCIAGRITPAGALPCPRSASSIPANLVLCVAVLWALFGGKDLGSATNTLIVETEDGETVKRVVPKTEFRKSTALFPLALGPGVGEDESWISYAVPEALVPDLPDVAPIPFFDGHTLQAGIRASSDAGRMQSIDPLDADFSDDGGPRGAGGRPGVVDWPNTWSGSRERCPGTGGWPNSIGSTAGTRTPARVWSGSSSSICEC